LGNIEVIGIKVIQPELDASDVVDKVVRAIIIIDLKEELDIFGEHDLLLYSKFFDYLRTVANFRHFLRIV
jgi:hypothetical protein